MIFKPRKMLQKRVKDKYKTQEAFAVISGMNETLVSKILRGVRDPTKDQIKTFERLLNTPASELFKQGGIEKCQEKQT
jgi:transcriptional regulator with XRE-family HTH domain